MPPPSEVQVICQWNKYDISKASARIDTKNGTQKMMEMKPFILSLFYAVLYVRSRFWFRHAMLWVGEHSVIYLTWFFFPLLFVQKFIIFDSGLRALALIST